MSMSKDSWYAGSSLTEKEKKVCRCLLEQQANELERSGKTSYNAFAVCISSVGGKEEKSYHLRSRLVQVVRSGQCTKSLHVSRLPTRFLYAYAKLREKTKKGSHFFKHLPSPREFFAAPQMYRAELLAAVRKYQASEVTKKRDK